MLTQRPEALQYADSVPNLSIRASSTSHGLDPLDLVAVLTLDHVSDVDDTAKGPGRSAVSIRSMQDRHANKRRNVYPYGSMEGGSVDELLGVSVEGPVLDQLQVKVGRTLEDRLLPGLCGDDREDRHLEAVDEAGGHQRPVHRQAAVGAQRHPRVLLEAGDDVEGVAIHDGRLWPVEGTFQRRRHHRCRHAPHPSVHRVKLVFLYRAQQLQELPEGVGPKDHPLLLADYGEAVVEELGALLAPVAAPVARGGVGAVAVEGGEDVEGVGSGHVVLLEQFVVVGSFKVRSLLI